MYDEDDMHDEPMDAQEIEEYLSFSSAFIEQADSDNVLFDVITSWSKERIVNYQRAFLMFNAVANPQAFGLED